MNFNKELNSRLFTQLENEQPHEEYNREYGFYSNIVHGDITAVIKTLCDPEDDTIYEKKQFGRLSLDKLRNIRYHYIVSVSLITRLCVDNGLDRELAYTLSDLYISEMDRLGSSKQILDMYNQMIMDYTRKMSELPKKQVFSIHVVKAIDYICKHRTERINAEMTALALNINRSYLSTLFFRETGISLSDYIRREKLGAAANMLIFSDYSYSEIAEYFGFSSQSHFIQCFKKETGLTPAVYRKEHFHG